jgi:hypothetical protein
MLKRIKSGPAKNTSFFFLSTFLFFRIAALGFSFNQAKQVHLP